MMNKKYTILVVANDSYMDLLQVYLNSLFANINQEHLKKIVIADLGLSDSNKEILVKLNKKITIQRTTITAKTQKVHSKEWIEAVTYKTKFLLGFAKQAFNLPVVLMDIDMLVLEDFSSIINSHYDLQFCKRTTPATRSDGMQLDYIASFMVANTVKAVPFIEGWISKIQERIEQKKLPAYETPALCDMINANTHRINIGELDEDIISCDLNYIANKTKIVHARSDGSDASLGIERYFSIKNFDMMQWFKYLNKNQKIALIEKINKINADKTEFEKAYERRFEPNLTINDKKIIISNMFWKRMGYIPNFENPKTFSEKLQWLKLNYFDPAMTAAADKVTARDYIANYIDDAEKYLVKQLGVYDSIDGINFDSLPQSFVLKSNWGSGAQIVVKDKSTINVNDLKYRMKDWLNPKNNHYYASLEIGYKDIVPKIICEEFLEFEYKLEFFCFNGEVKAFWIIFDDKTDKVRANFYTLDWQQIPFNHKYPNFKEKVSKPTFFDDMVEFAKKLCEPFPHVRVDFYKQKNSFVFCEMTFFHWAGMTPFTPAKYDILFGDMLELPKSKGVKIKENPELGLGNIELKLELVKQGFPIENEDMLMAQQVSASFIKGDMKKIVNIGAGIGTFEMYAAPANVDKLFFASEFDKPSIEWAKKNRSFANVGYSSDDIDTLIKKHKKFDFAVTIDVIEHIKDYKMFLDDFVKLSDKALIVTPNRDFGLDRRMKMENGIYFPRYPYHVQEFNYGELYYILKMYYKSVKIFAQQNSCKQKIDEVGFYTTCERLFALCEN